MKLLSKILAVLLLSGGLTVSAQGTKQVISLNELPTKAQEFIKKHFNSQKAVSIIKDTENLLDVEYKTIYNNMVISFDSKGEWEEVDGKRNAIPTTFIPQEIVNHIQKSFPDNNIVKIEKGKRKYEVEISNGLDLEFTKAGAFLRIDG